MAPADAADLAALARLLEATARRTRNLRREQRHDDARRNALALARLARTAHELQAVHGFMAALAVGPELAEAGCAAAGILAEAHFPA